MSYFDQLIAAGIPEEQAQRDAWANEIVRFRNRDSYMEQADQEAEEAA